MIKVLFIISNLNPQGPINQLFYLCKYLRRDKVLPLIVTTSQLEFNNSMHQTFKSIDVDVIDLKLNKIKSLISSKSYIQSIIDENNIHIIVSYGFRSDIIALYLKRVYKITTVRNTLLENWKITWGLLLGSLFGQINLYFIRRFDKVISCSFSVKKYLQTLNVESTAIVNAVETNVTTDITGTRQKSIMRDKLNLPPDKGLFITVSSKLRGKNVEFLINSFRQEPLNDNILLIAGYVRQELKKRYSNGTNIYFLGKIDNLQNYFVAVDYFVSASVHEGMPNSVLEALSLGRPVILSNIQPHKEIIFTENKIIGTLFKNNSTADLQSKIYDISMLDYDSLSNNCIELVKRRFSADVMAEGYEKLFLEVFQNDKF